MRVAHVSARDIKKVLRHPGRDIFRASVTVTVGDQNW